MTIYNNKLGGHAVIQLNGAGTTTINLADLAIGTEVVSGLIITGICWSTNGSITIARGANTAASLHNAGQWDLSKCGGAMSADRAATIVVTIATGGSILLSVSKNSSVTGL